MRSNEPSLVSLKAMPPKRSDNNNGTTFSNPYNDEAFGLIFLNAAIVFRDFDFAASFLLISAIAATAVSAGAVRGRSSLPGTVAFVSLAVARLVETSGVSPVDWASDWMVTSELGPAFGLETEGVLLVEIALCTVSLLWGIVQGREDNT